jgi:hypothetical protein
MRPRLLGCSVLAVSLIAAGATAAHGTSSAAAETVYRLRPDPRMCPSPVCGGFWAARVNVATTTCIGGDTRPACYVAAVDLGGFAPTGAARIRAAIARSRALVDGGIVRYPHDVFPQLGSLLARSAWLPAGSGDAHGTVYRLVDTGIRCIRAPCFSLRATVVNGTPSVKLSEVDLDAAGVPGAARRRARALLRRGGILVAGSVHAVSDPAWPDTGRGLTATQVWLPA